MSNKLIPSLSVTDGVDFVKKIWGSLPIPSVMSPTTDLEELDKRISDLKAVEQWLNVNLSMLRATIQGLEVQRGTVAAIKSFGANLGKTGAYPKEDLGGEGDANPMSPYVDEEFFRKAVVEAVRESAVPPVPSSQPAATAVPDAPSPQEAPKSDQSASKDKASKSEESSSSVTGDASKAILSNATAWFGLLQEQFNKVATAAMSGAGLNESEPEKKKKSSRSKTNTEKSSASAKTSSKAKPSSSTRRSTRTRSQSTSTRKSSTGRR